MCIYTCIYVCMYMYIYIYIHVCIYMYTYISSPFLKTCTTTKVWSGGTAPLPKSVHEYEFVCTWKELS